MSNQIRFRQPQRLTLMHWVYVLRSDDDDIYVGETTRLFRRWNEHQTGRGGVNTSHGNYETIVAVYNVASNRSFARYISDNFVWRCERYWDDEVDKQDALAIENFITERLLTDRGITRYTIRGGKYLTEEKCEKFCSIKNQHQRDRPLCKCGYPCEVKMKKDKTKIYFVCPVPEWVEGFNVPDKCNFWQEYEPYRKMREELSKPKIDIREVFSEPF